MSLSLIVTVKRISITKPDLGPEAPDSPDTADFLESSSVNLITPCLLFDYNLDGLNLETQIHDSPLFDNI